MTRTTRILPVSVVLLLTASCGLTGDREAVVGHTINEYGALAPLRAPPADDLPVLALEEFTADDELETRMLTHRPKDGAGFIHNYDGTHNWSSLPRVMLGRRAWEICRRRLGNKIHLAAYPAEQTPKLRLRTRVLRFDEVRAQGATTGEAVVVLDYDLFVWTVREDPGQSGWVRLGPGRARGTQAIIHREGKLLRGFDPEAYSAGLRAAADKALATICDAIASQIEPLPRE